MKSGDPTSKIILAKWDGASAAELREWRFYVASDDTLILELSDESADVNVHRPSSSAIGAGQWAFCVATYEGAGGASAADTITIYVNGAQTNGTAQNNASYVAMEDLATLPLLGANIGSSGALANLWSGEMAGGPIGPFFTQKELSATEVLDLYHIGAHAMGLA